jgi:hypothetical protein
MPRNWQGAKNALVQQRADMFIENRLAELDLRARQNDCKVESVEDFLRRGGKIKRGNFTEAQKIENISKNIEKEPQALTNPPCLNIMKAVDAAMIAKQDPLCTVAKIAAVIPEYKAPLPRRSWIAKFRAALDPQDNRFIDLF